MHSVTTHSCGRCACPAAAAQLHSGASKPLRLSSWLEWESGRRPPSPHLCCSEAARWRADCCLSAGIPGSGSPKQALGAVFKVGHGASPCVSLAQPLFSWGPLGQMH